MTTAPGDKVTFTRQQLYELVWKEPVRNLAATIGISNVALAKACRRLNIPLLGRGYWAKVAAGHSLTRVPFLPEIHGRSEVRFGVRRSAPPRVPLERLARAADANIEPGVKSAPPSAATIEISDLSKPHPLTRCTRSGLRRQRSDSRGLRHASPATGWRISASEDVVERALVVLDSICHALKHLGAVIRDGRQESWQESAPKEVYLDSEPVQIAIREHTRMHRRTTKELAAVKAAGESYPRATEYRPSGVLVVSICNAPDGSVKEWRDSKSSTLEAQLPAIVAALAALPAVLKQARREKEEAEKAFREAEHRRWKRAERERRNKERLAELAAEARALDDQRSILSYLDHVERIVAERGWAVTEKLAKGIAKARDLAGKLDPTEHRVALLQTFGFVTEVESRYWHDSEDEDDSE